MTSHTPIFETLAPGDVYILFLIDGCVKYITNVDGVASLRTSCGETLYD